ncbi:glycine--tRNA ligase subunit beta [Aphanizomenon flos-aquae NRERC-008]|uniref:Glycine--tRNA ligase beta subunit n=1 Tax=Aphanizomenon flos-aquae FACHB-1249 TaxID=2692889 RepID=A0ABR8IXP6_APHFL|nr:MULTISPECIES: glycine--tRNA ligase subunit beta [Aphanizomenon]MBD2389816.1 glycine--tRNA ligase subunit beta [Aphanizomenon flos-aquae FACHB-1171]MBD2557568.1 glycine--tRNA ligase subunit beta [Aphanizomenon flos-aquae FACHB-1290]MBD2630728.1 glycine--tRNA ligase subunit beta [Aphanizomenon sp. FACHB-1399]MBD2644617.1 glycine--tRNA ligase subunit beta [Aphanizomenon sp. FACHB-1401]MBD2656049.1 glycine--tRNA ligase subunit beta [Aphanizomenon flos-aquae FACHB-1265]
MPAFLLEVGTEELPAGFLSDAIVQWKSRIPESLKTHNLPNAAVEVYGTPRRLAVLITGLPSQQADREEEIKGPPAQAAFKDGQPTKAAIGFATKQGVDISALEIRPTDKGDFVFVNKQIPGRPIADILTELVPQWVWNLEGKRLMRWGHGDGRFSRPIRWLVTLLDEEILPLQLENGAKVVKSNRLSRTHRVLHPEPVSISHATEYVKTLSSGYVNVPPENRGEIITNQVKAAAEKLGGYTPIYPDLLAEVVNLVEYPTAVIGKFEEEFLKLPKEVITEVMVSHQRYFPVFKNAECQELLPNFITISNGDPAKSDIIAVGNARVIRARLADGRFFYEADLSKPLESYLPQLEKVTFQEDLGSVYAKIERIVKNAEKITTQLQLNPAQTHNIQRAALLCKADLVTQMVYEFPELQGIMGEKYALANGENPEVAKAIFEHYLPRNADDIFPQTLTGQIVGLADRLDTLTSIFGLGLIPSGSSDPFALRRAANAIINITWLANLPINLSALLAEITADFAAAFNKDAKSLIKTLQEFFLQRIRTLLQDEKQIDYDLVNAVLGENDPEYTERALTDLLDVRDRSLYLQKIRKDGTLDKIYETVNRSTRLAAQGNLDFQTLEPQTLIKPELFQKKSEFAFYNALLELVPQTQAAQQNRDYQLLVTALTKIAPTVGTFFDGEDSVLVMDENPDIKQNRLNLLGLLRNNARLLADFGAIVKNL